MQVLICRASYKGCPNKSGRFKVRAIVVLLGWRQWKCNVCRLSLLRLVVMERCAKEHRVSLWQRITNMGKVMWKQLAKCHLTQWRSELATEVVRFDTVRLLSLGVCEISCLCQQTKNNSWAQGGDSTCHWRNWAAIMLKCHREFRRKNKSVSTESWGTFVGYCVPQLIVVCVLYTEIKISALFE
jgi:hypothetical protein